MVKKQQFHIIEPNNATSIQELIYSLQEVKTKQLITLN